ncbi:MAG: hypothetical protein QNK36_20395 [Colwellia sp.]|nr:hypothetical protein [Colwellia sp.]
MSRDLPISERPMAIFSCNDQIAENATNILIAQVRKLQSKNVINQYVPQLVVKDSTGKV